MTGTFSFIHRAKLLSVDFLTTLYTSSYRRKMINKEVLKYKAGLACASMHFFKVTYNKHTLALEDLSTLEDQNWVNDQVGHGNAPLSIYA